MWLALSSALAIEVTLDPAGTYPSIGSALGDPQVTVIVVPGGDWELPGSIDRAIEIRGAGPMWTTLYRDGRVDLYAVDEPVRITDARLERAEGSALVRVYEGALLEVERTVWTGVEPGWGVEGPSDDALVRVDGTFRAFDSDFRDNGSVIGPSMIEGDYGSTIELTGCVVGRSIGWSEFGWQGGDPGFAGAIAVRGGTLDLVDSVVVENLGTQVSAIALREGSFGRLDNVIVGTNAALEGGGIQVSDSTIEVSRTEFFANYGVRGSALDAWDSDVVLDDVTVGKNRATNGSPLRVLRGSVSITDSRFRDNLSDAQGGAAFRLVETTGAVVRTAVCENHGPVDGGAVRLENAQIGFTNNLIWANEGGGIAVASGAATIQSCALVDNLNPTGAAVRGTAFLIIDTLLAGHDLPGNTTLVSATNPADADLSHNAYHDTALPNQGGVQDLGSNVDDDARLHVWPPRDCRLSDYRLRSDSPLIGAGSNAGTDIGIYSGSGSPLVGGDADGDGLSVVYDCDDADPGRTDPVRVFPNDRDFDGFADAVDPGQPFDACPEPGRVTEGGDCNDGDAQIYPGAAEDIGGLDRDCDTWLDPAVRARRACASVDASVGPWGGLLGVLVRRRGR